MPDALRLALGTLTAVRVPAPRRVTPVVAGRAMLLAPLVGVLLALVVAAVPAVVSLLAPDRRTTSLVDLLTSAMSIGLLALLTRGLHLDGLADTADGLGVKGVDEGAVARRLAVMRAPDVGAFGAITVVVVLLLQVTALAVCTAAGVGTAALVVAAATGRLAATWCCTTGVPSARPDGLGAAVAGTVPRVAAAATTVAVLLLALLAVRLTGGADLGHAVVGLVAVGAGLACGAVLLRRCVARLGGVSGDVLGAVVEVTTTAALVVAALATVAL